ncbi:hypothetical protein H2201_003096 [Coniosporium apollinis]|uniref:DUF7730 domain-containing protein n=1 Tax=Coniosporium apollinis TaxID=61459 RepID=A0ABQ9NWC9_9PEZI|nr:hypothetical protein H2201_003096 [Coniosporium apollinis]
MALLRVCRQIYNEARLIPYSSNTFSFTLASTFSTFLTSLLPAQRRATTSLHLLVRSDRFFRIDDSSYLEYATEGEGATAWTRALTVRKIMTLPNLKTLHLSLCAEPFNALGSVKEVMAEPEAYLPLLRAVSKFQRLPLEAVTVILSDDPNTNLGEVFFREALRQDTSHSQWEYLRERTCLTAEKKREWAVRIRRRLLQSWDQSQSPEAVKARRKEEWARKRKRQETDRSTEVRKRYCLRGITETEV